MSLFLKTLGFGPSLSKFGSRLLSNDSLRTCCISGSSSSPDDTSAIHQKPSTYRQMFGGAMAGNSVKIRQNDAGS